MNAKLREQCSCIWNKVNFNRIVASRDSMTAINLMAMNAAKNVNRVVTLSSPQHYLLEILSPLHFNSDYYAASYLL